MPNQFTASLWGDEGFSAILSMKTVPEIIEIIINDTSPPLWNLTERLAFNIFGTSEVVIRGLAFLFFLLTIFFTYKIGVLLWNKRTGLLAASLTFLNPFFFIYAFEGRMYSILALGVTASMYFFLKILSEKKPRLSTKIGYVIATSWALYSHHFAIFALFIQGLWFLYEFLLGRRKQSISIFKSLLVVAILYIPWLYPLYKQAIMVGGGFWLGTPTPQDLWFLIKEYLALGIKHDLAIPALYLVFVVLALRRWGKNIKISIFLLSFFLGPIVLTWIVSQKFQSIFFNRYLLYAIPAGMLVVASNGKKFTGIAIGLLLILFGIIDINYFTHPTKRPFREMATYVKSTLKGDDFLINWNAGSHHLWETKYYGIPSPIYIAGEGELPFFVGTALMEESDIVHEIPKGTNRVGVTTSGEIKEIELPGFIEDSVKDFGRGLKFVWYNKN